MDVPVGGGFGKIVKIGGKLPVTSRSAPTTTPIAHNSVRRGRFGPRLLSSSSRLEPRGSNDHFPPRLCKNVAPLERETQRNVELMWLTGRLTSDFKTIANFRKDNGQAIRGACRQFIELCRQLNLSSEAVVAIDGSGFKAVNNRDRNYTSAKYGSALSISRPASLDTSPRWTRGIRTTGDHTEQARKLKEKIAALKKRVEQLKEIEVLVQAAPDRHRQSARASTHGRARHLVDLRQKPAYRSGRIYGVSCRPLETMPCAVSSLPSPCSRVSVPLVSSCTMP